MVSSLGRNRLDLFVWVLIANDWLILGTSILVTTSTSQNDDNYDNVDDQFDADQRVWNARETLIQPTAITTTISISSNRDNG